MKKRIHVNQHAIKRNLKRQREKSGEPLEPCITVKTYKSNTYANEVIILGDSKVIYRPDNPLSCGAKVWIETTAEIKIN